MTKILKRFYLSIFVVWLAFFYAYCVVAQAAQSSLASVVDKASPAVVDIYAVQVTDNQLINPFLMILFLIFYLAILLNKKATEKLSDPVVPLLLSVIRDYW